MMCLMNGDLFESSEELIVITDSVDGRGGSIQPDILPFIRAFLEFGWALSHVPSATRS